MEVGDSTCQGRPPAQLTPSLLRQSMGTALQFQTFDLGGLEASPRLTVAFQGPEESTVSHCGSRQHWLGRPAAPGTAAAGSLAAEQGACPGLLAH